MAVDSEYAFLSDALGMEGSIQDLRLAYYKAAANGTLPAAGEQVIKWRFPTADRPGLAEGVEDGDLGVMIL